MATTERWRFPKSRSSVALSTSKSPRRVRPIFTALFCAHKNVLSMHEGLTVVVLQVAGIPRTLQTESRTGPHTGPHTGPASVVLSASVVGLIRRGTRKPWSSRGPWLWPTCFSVHCCTCQIDTEIGMAHWSCILRALSNDNRQPTARLGYMWGIGTMIGTMIGRTMKHDWEFTVIRLRAGGHGAPHKQQCADHRTHSGALRRLECIPRTHTPRLARPHCSRRKKSFHVSSVISHEKNPEKQKWRLQQHKACASTDATVPKTLGISHAGASTTKQLCERGI